MMSSERMIVYVDMDHVLCDYDAGFKAHQNRYCSLEFPQSQPGLYLGLKPIEGAIESYVWLHQHPLLSVYILTAPSIRNPHCYSEKRLWVEQYLGFDVVERLIITPNKGLNKGHFLIDDCLFGKGQEDFEGELIHFGSSDFPDWGSVKRYFDGVLSK